MHRSGRKELYARGNRGIAEIAGTHVLIAENHNEAGITVPQRHAGNHDKLPAGHQFFHLGSELVNNGI